MTEILFIDDDQICLDWMRRLLRDMRDVWAVDYVSDPKKALALIEYKAYDAIFSDIRMPGYDGFEILKAVQTSPLNAMTPVVLMTGLSDNKLKRQALHSGATDLLNKPIEQEDIFARLHSVLRIKHYEDCLRSYNHDLEEKIAHRTRELEHAHREIILRLAKAAEMRDTDTGNHVIRVANYARFLAREIGAEEEFAKLIFLASPLHDIGKIAVPDRILRKPGELSDIEMDVMREHCIAGERLLSSSFGKFSLGLDELYRDGELPEQIEMLQMAARIALYHHEWWNGRGYPCGIAGKDIPLEARIVAVADVFDALTSTRPYKPAFPEEKALEIMRADSGTHFDPEIFEALERSFDKIVAVKREFTDFNDGSYRKAA